MQLKPCYIDVSDLILTEFPRWQFHPRCDPVEEGLQDSESSLQFTVSVGSCLISDCDILSGCPSEFQNSDSDNGLDFLEECSLQENFGRYCWEEEFNEYGDVINKQLVRLATIQTQIQAQQSSVRDQDFQKNQPTQDLDSFSDRNHHADSHWENIPKGSFQAWWDQPRKNKVQRYLRKKERRYLGNKFSYDFRRTVASFRLRIKGKFIGKGQAQKILGEQIYQMSTEEVRERLNKYFKDS